jgi:lysophospholipase L1-like esterase
VALPATNLAEHYIAGTGESVTGALIDSWASQVGGYAATGVTTARPTKTTDANGFPIVRFPQESSCKLTTNGPAYSSTAFSIWFLARVLAPPAAAVSNLAGINGYGGGSANLRVFSSNAVPPTLYSVGVASTIRVPINLNVYGLVSAAGSTTFYDAWGSMAAAAATADATNTGGVEIGAFANVLFAKMDVYEIAIFSAAQSAQDQADTAAYFRAGGALGVSIPSTRPPNILVLEGESTTYGHTSTGNQTYPYLLSIDPDFGERWRVHNFGVNGSTVASQTTRAGSVDALLADSATRKAIISAIGFNNASGGNDGATIYAAVDTYAEARIAATAGLEYYQATPIAAANTTVNDRLTALATLIRSGIVADTGAAGYVDFRADPVFDTAADAGNATYYSDGTHLTNAGNAVLRDIVLDHADFATASPGASAILFDTAFGFGF